MAVKGQRDLGPQHLAQAQCVAGAFRQHEARRVGIDADEPQDLAPLDELAAEAAQMAGRELRIAPARHAQLALIWRGSVRVRPPSLSACASAAPASSPPPSASPTPAPASASDI